MTWYTIDPSEYSDSDYITSKKHHTAFSKTATKSNPKI